MVPPRVHPGTPSSERRIFDLLDRADGTDDWWALHSLALSRRGNRAFGEADFVLGIPGLGILVIEVKGGRVTEHEGEWSSTSKDGVRHRLLRSPVLQARDASFGVFEAIQERFGSFSEPGRVVVGSIAVFTDSVAPPEQPAFERWEILDYHDLQSGDPIDRLRDAMRRSAGRFAGEDRRRFARPEVLSEIREFLRPDFDGAIPRAAHINESEVRILRLTKEQFRVLDLVADNKRCLIRGGAGTGKTVLALEHARRSAAAGERTLLLCFNRPLAESLRHTLAEEGTPNVEVATCHSFLRARVLESGYCDEFRERERELQAAGKHEQLFSETYPLFGALAAESAERGFDRLIIDEGQDLVQPDILSALGEWLAGGLEEGRWAIFGDFDNQAIYSGSESEVSSGLQSLLRTGSPARLRLSRNFRNSPSIGRELTILCGFERAPFEIADPGADCLPVNYLEWKNPAEQSGVVRQELTTLLDSGVRREDIVLLSPNRFERSVAKELMDLRVEVRESAWSMEGKIGFSTVHRFKGLESPVIVLCDLEAIADFNARSLLYVGMSRAKSYLAVALSTSARRQAREQFRNYLKNSGESL